MDNHEPCGDTLENNFRKRAQHPSERDMLKFKGYLLHGVVGEGTYSKVKVKITKLFYFLALKIVATFRHSPPYYNSLSKV